MGSGIYIASAGAKAQSNALDVTANNIANASTTGYKAQRLSFGEALTAAQSPDTTYVGVAGTKDDMTAGTLVDTGNALDLALVGDGFFAVEAPGGTRYTRAGDFRLDAEGRMVNGAGLPARAVGGGTISIPAGTAEVTVDGTGRVLADGAEVGQLELARFAPESITREGNNLYVAQGAALAGEQPEVVAGALEQSNINVVRGMVDMVRVSRTYQALVRMIESYKEVDSRTAQGLGKP